MDQSAWFYYGGVLKALSSDALSSEKELLETLRSEEPNCPYLLITLFEVSKMLDSKPDELNYCLKIIEHLKHVDPLRMGMYEEI